MEIAENSNFELPKEVLNHIPDSMPYSKVYSVLCGNK
jgi:hypothetical protein